MSSPKKIFHALSTFWIAAALTFTSACTKKDSAGGPVGEGEVNLAIWGNYLSPEAVARFQKETGLKLNVTNYSSNEELLAKIQSGGAGLDVAVPSDYMVDVLGKLNLLEPLDKARIPNAAGLVKDFLGLSYDPENRVSLPYSVSITGIAVDRDVYKDPVTSWKDLLDNPKLAGKFALLDDVREVSGAALLLLGSSVNSVDEKKLAEVRDLLLKTRKNVKMFTSDTIDILKNREVAAAQAFSMDVLQAGAATGGRIEFVIPKEGSTRAVDNLVILKGAPHPESAHRLINFLLSPENNLEFVLKIRSTPVVQGVREKLPPDLKDNPALFPDKALLGRLERVQDLGEKNRLYEDLWTKVKTAR
ncbi:MAG: spermidine/putrescine ABC transporter substrate-binding protein [Bdellovibrionaceae bacterium]|nr:spermidine/putrescine ABC transporter substrate-binding protein [Pseudobdellovibrionaceae bacterium]